MKSIYDFENYFKYHFINKMYRNLVFASTTFKFLSIPRFEIHVFAKFQRWN